MSKRIEVRDIRRGDLIRCEYEYTVRDSLRAVEYEASHDRHDYYGSLGKFYLLERPFQWPTKPGTYTLAGEAKDIWYLKMFYLTPVGEWHEYGTAKEMSDFAREQIESGEWKLTRMVLEK